MQVTIKDVSVEWSGAGNRKYGKAVVRYDFKGEARTQNVMSFSNPEVFKKVQELVGQAVEVELAKNDKGYTEWKSVTAGAGPTSTPGSAPAATRVSGSNYETKEERAARQVLIVKQSSLSAAVATLTPGAKAPLKTDEVLAQAQAYTNWVFSRDEVPDDSDDDIPF